MTEANDQWLPNGWCSATVGDLAEYINGAAFKPTDWTAEGIPIIRIQNLTDLTKRPNRTNRKVNPRLLIREGDLLFSWSATLDAFLWHGEDAWLNQHIFKVEPVDPIGTRFLFYLLRHAVREIIRSEHMHGSTMQHINRRPFLSHQIGLPPQQEQERITEALDELLSDLDAGVAALERVRAKLKHYRASVLKAAVEGTLTADWRAKHPDTKPASALLQRILTERRRGWEETQLEKFKAAGKEPPKNWKSKYKEPVAADTSNLTVLPERWCWASAEQLTAFITKGTTPPGDQAPQSVGEIPFIKVQHLSGTGGFHFDESPAFVSRTTHEKFLARSKVFPGDVLMNIVGPPLGQVSIVPVDHPEWNVNQAIAIFRPLGAIPQKFIAICLLARTILAQALRQTKTTAGQVNLTLEVCRTLAIPLPPLEEQQTIVEVVEDQLSIIDHLEADLEAKVTSAQVLRQSILHHAFEGKLVPQDPNDEPASELLKSIAAELEERARLVAAAKQADKKAKPAKATKTTAPRKRAAARTNAREVS